MTLCLNFPECPLSGKEHEHSGEAVVMKSMTYTIEELKKMQEGITKGNREWLGDPEKGLYDVVSDNDDEVLGMNMPLNEAEFLIAAPAICDQLIDILEEKELETKIFGKPLTTLIAEARQEARSALIEEIREVLISFRDEHDWEKDAEVSAYRVLNEAVLRIDSLKKDV